MKPPGLTCDLSIYVLIAFMQCSRKLQGGDCSDDTDLSILYRGVIGARASAKIPRSLSIIVSASKVESICSFRRHHATTICWKGVFASIITGVIHFANKTHVLLLMTDMMFYFHIA